MGVAVGVAYVLTFQALYYVTILRRDDRDEAPGGGGGRDMSRAVCVYCGSVAAGPARYADAARRVGSAWVGAGSAWSTAAGGPG